MQYSFPLPLIQTIKVIRHAAKVRFQAVDWWCR
jgi:hypothetical protein